MVELSGMQIGLWGYRYQRVRYMQFRIGILAWSIVLVCFGLAGCAGGSSSGTNNSYMGRCEAAATTKQERSECSWKNAERMASH
jgi:hypothetical protein